MTDIRTCACIGGGVIGAGWVARLVANGLDVAVFDPDPAAETKLSAVLANADRAMVRLTAAPMPPKGRIRFAQSIGHAVADADLVVESVPERVDLKLKVLGEADASAPDDAIIASSTSGILPSDLQAGMRRPERFLVAHPFNPVYLLPAVEIVGGRGTGSATIARAMSFYPTIGMRPIHIRKEIEAFVADRLLESIWREALWLIKDGICTTAELDDVIRYGFGLRFAQMGIFDTYRVAGGEAGMRHFMAQFGPCLAWPWSHMTDVPEFNDALVDLITTQSDDQSGHIPIREMERIRDDNLIAIQQALKGNGWGAGQILAEYEKQLFGALAASQTTSDHSRPIETIARDVPADWTDYNRHMNEARYLQCFSDASDAFLAMIGCDAQYVASGGSYFTVESHIRHLGEALAGDRIRVMTQVIDATGKRLRLFHRLERFDGTLLATGEHMLIHVSLSTRSASSPSPEIRQALDGIARLHAALPLPDGLGRAVGQPR